MRKNRTSPAELLGLILGSAAILLTVSALIYVIRVRPFQGALRLWAPRRLDWSGPWEREEGVEELEGGFSSLSVANVSGPVQIEGWNENRIRVRWEKQARGRQALQDLRIQIERQGQALSVRPIYPTPAGLRFGSVSFQIRVPAGLKEIKVRNVSGRIQVRGLESEAAQDLETVSGSIETERSGDLRLKSVSGSIDFSFAGSRLSARSISGRISGAIRGLKPGGSVDIDAVSGAVELEAFAGLDAALNLSSVSGSISCDFPVQILQKKRNRLEGRIGGGAAPLTIKTVSGGIRLKKAE